MVLWVNRSRRSPAGLAPWLLVGVPFGFYVALALHRADRDPARQHDGSSRCSTLRYGVETLPGLVVFAALGVWVVAQAVHRSAHPRAWIAVLVGAALVLGVAQVALWWPGWSATPVVAEGLSQRAAKPGEDAAAQWMARPRRRRHDR